MPEARATDGWFVVNVRDAEWLTSKSDLFPCPAGTENVFVGAGDRPCVILRAGARWGDWKVRDRVSELAARSWRERAGESTTPREAYIGMGFAPSRRERPSYWARLPWA